MACPAAKSVICHVIRKHYITHPKHFNRMVETCLDPLYQKAMGLEGLQRKDVERFLRSAQEEYHQDECTVACPLLRPEVLK